MDIFLSPIMMSGTLTASKQGDILTINGEKFDFSSLPDGASIAAANIPCVHIIDEVVRLDGVLKLTLLLPHSELAGENMRFPEPILNAGDGAINLPMEPVFVEPPMPTQAIFDEVQKEADQNVEA